MTVACLLPFSGKAFHVDDTLFLFSAQQIVKHPLDPYGFQLVWNTREELMSDITKNPPLACYYAALVGGIGGWSERALHIGFLLFALGVTMGTYRLAQLFTKSPWAPFVAAVATLIAPGFLISATSVMCDTMMLALWIWAIVFWIRGIDATRPAFLLASSILITASALTKYFGVSLIPLLLLYSLHRRRRAGWWLAYFAIPILVLIAYEFWSAGLYGRGLIASAMEFAGNQRDSQQGSLAAHALVSLSFFGGCALSILPFAPLLWSRKQIIACLLAGVLGSASLLCNWVEYGARVGGDEFSRTLGEHWLLIGAQLAVYIACGICILLAAFFDAWRERSPQTWLLLLWIAGTWVFTGFLNWTVNARSALPMIPAVAILLSLGLDQRPTLVAQRWVRGAIIAGLAIVGVFSFWVTSADMALANVAREAAAIVQQKTAAERGHVFFLGHWGFQYYMETRGYSPGGLNESRPQVGDVVVIPSNNTEIAPVPEGLAYVAQPDRSVELMKNRHITPLSASLGAGFYSSYWGPLPFAIGDVPSEFYFVARVIPASQVPHENDAGSR